MNQKDQNFSRKRERKPLKNFKLTKMLNNQIFPLANERKIHMHNDDDDDER